MFKVICIDNKNIGRSLNEYNKLLKEGAIYTVIGEIVGQRSDNKNEFGYVLEEFKYLYTAFIKDRFIPLSEIDETEMINQKESVNS